MDYLKSFKNFINSYYLTEGVRKTAGIVLPVLVLSYFDQFPLGTEIAIGAMCLSITDNPGTLHQKRNDMLVCNAAIFIMAVIVGLVAHSVVWLGITLLVFTFFFSMLGVYGLRVNSIGIAALIVMLLNIYQVRSGYQIIFHALYFLAGGVWYMLFCLALYSFRPYKLARQTLGDWIQSISDYLKKRASFYDKELNVDMIYRDLLQEQITVQENQNLINELLFKTRSIVKESSHAGRILVMIYLDAAELFERIMTAYQDYNTLHDFFDETTILPEYKKLALELANELDEIGLALKSDKRSHPNTDLAEHIKKVKEQLNELRKTFLKPANLEGFIYLRNIINNIQDINDRIQVLHQYTTFDTRLRKRSTHVIDHENFISQADYSPKVLLDNFSLQSDIFRHSLRLSIAIITGFLVAQLFSIGHSYWILLTIAFILKPAYSLTKKRNIDRLIGTICGILLGMGLLKLVSNNTALLVCLIVLMAGSYSFVRKYYFVSVLLMTPYLLIFFHFLNTAEFKTLLTERAIDTAIGSFIAFLASFALLPSWEHRNIKNLMMLMLEANGQYFKTVAEAYGKEKTKIINRFSMVRRDAFVALANLSGAFNRMISEPRSKQKEMQQVHQFVVLNHMLTSHIASLSYYVQSAGPAFPAQDFKTVSTDIIQYVNNTISRLKKDGSKMEQPNYKKSLQILNEQADLLLEKRKKELQMGQLETDTKEPLREIKSIVDQFNFIYKIVMDIDKVSESKVG